MAHYRPADSDDPLHQRIDGFVWDGRRQTPTIRLWTPVQQRPSQRFNRYNSQARLNDQIYAGLPDGDKAHWAEWAAENASKVYCEQWISRIPPPPPTDIARSAYMSVNMWLLLQGIGSVTVPPISIVLVQHDVLTLSISLVAKPAWPPPANYLTIIWTGRTDPPSEPCYIAIWATPLNHEPESGTTPRRAQALTIFAISYDTETDLTPLLQSNPGLLSANFLSLGLALGQSGDVPFATFRGGADLQHGDVSVSGWGDTAWGDFGWGD